VDFRLDNEQLALQGAVRAFCADRYPLDAIGSRDGMPLSSTRWGELLDLGAFSLLAPVADGTGERELGFVEAALVFEQFGACLADGPILWSTLAASVVGSVADGSSVAGGFDAVDADGEPFIVEHAADLDVLVVLRPDGVFVIERGDLPEPEVLEPLDPLTPVARFGELPAGTQVAPADRSAAMRNEGAVLSAAMLLGISEAALRAARDYSLEREQFGQPIGSFQALKHMMADMFVRTALARSATYAAAAVLDDPLVGHVGRSIGAAKLLAGEAAIENARASVQVMGGMGFTWEMVPHYLLKRAWVLEQSFGTMRDHALGISASLASEDR
jgi:alkylation response protein AidB-like acyl-CoA dehydrogenase